MVIILLSYLLSHITHGLIAALTIALTSLTFNFSYLLSNAFSIEHASLHLFSDYFQQKLNKKNTKILFLFLPNYQFEEAFTTIAKISGLDVDLLGFNVGLPQMLNYSDILTILTFKI